MKIQDISFFVALVILLLSNRPRIVIGVGIFCFVLAIPLYQTWVFFTAERLMLYGAGFITAGSIMMLREKV